MKEMRQQELIHWLKQQSIISSYWLNFSRLLGLSNGLLVIAQAWLLAYILQKIIIESISRKALLISFSILMLVVTLRSFMLWLREIVSFRAGQHIRYKIRHQLLNKLEKAGPAWIQNRPIGSWVTLIIEQIDDMHDYYARYLPQISLAISVPLLIIITILPINWIAALILLFTAPLIPLFMSMIGMGAAEANRRNFLALARLSGHFLDRLRGMETLRIFGCGMSEIENIRSASNNFRKHTMEVLRIAFLSSGVLEFFASLSIALVAAYFGFSYLGALDFGHYNTAITLLSGLLTLILAPEFFQPLRDLGTFYHSKARAVGAADNLQSFFKTSLANTEHGKIMLNKKEPFTLVAKNFSIISPEGKVLVGPLNFNISAGQRIGLVGFSGSGKSSLINALCGFMAYTGSLLVNGIELRNIEISSWRAKLSWVGQNPQLPAITLIENVLLGRSNTSKEALMVALNHSLVSEFLPLLPNGVNTMIGDQGTGLSIGQAQRVAIARALLHPCNLLLLDEPVASLDLYSEQHVMRALDTLTRQQTTIMITHQLENIVEWDHIWVMHNGRIVEQGNFATLANNNAQGHFITMLKSRQNKSI